jgi:glycosyltransferase involved in cell wall biosynthesis
MQAMKIAIVADWLTTYAGSERVLEQMIACFPQADVFAVVDFVPPTERGFLQGKRPKTTFIQKLPLARKYARHYLPLMPLAIEQLDLSAYDLILSSSHAVAKGVIVGPDQLHISYVHSPIRYAWDLQHQYLRESGLEHGIKSWLVRCLLHRIRLWDQHTQYGVDQFIANSGFIARRIHRVYGRDATVIYPPVDVSAFTLQPVKENFYLAASRLVPYKRMDLIVEAFAQMPDKKLVLIGDGPDMAKIRAKAGPNVKIMGYQPFNVLRDHMQRARAFVFAAEEDFGIAPVEAQACGTPVIAYGKGGALETVRGLGAVETNPTGLFFAEQTPAAIAAAVAVFERQAAVFDPAVIRRHAEHFSTEYFKETYRSFVLKAVEDWRQSLSQSKVGGAAACDA